MSNQVTAIQPEKKIASKSGKIYELESSTTYGANTGAHEGMHIAAYKVYLPYKKANGIGYELLGRLSIRVNIGDRITGKMVIENDNGVYHL